MPVIFNHLFTHGQNFTHTVQIPPVRNFLEVPALWNCNFSFLVNYTRTLTQQAKLDTDEITWIFSFDCVQRVVQMMIIKKCNTWRHPAFSPSFRLYFFFFSERSCLNYSCFRFFPPPDGCSHSSVSTSLDSTSRPITTSLWKLFWLTRITGAFREESGSHVGKRTIICKVSWGMIPHSFSSGKFVFLCVFCFFVVF